MIQINQLISSYKFITMIDKKVYIDVIKEKELTNLEDIYSKIGQLVAYIVENYYIDLSKSVSYFLQNILKEDIF